jgi:hypothetical protein
MFLEHRPPGLQLPVVPVVVGRENVGEPLRHELSGALTPAPRHEQRGCIHLHDPAE